MNLQDPVYTCTHKNGTRTCMYGYRFWRVQVWVGKNLPEGDLWSSLTEPGGPGSGPEKIPRTWPGPDLGQSSRGFVTGYPEPAPRVRVHCGFKITNPYPYPGLTLTVTRRVLPTRDDHYLSVWVLTRSLPNDTFSPFKINIANNLNLRCQRPTIM